MACFGLAGGFEFTQILVSLVFPFLLPEAAFLRQNQETLQVRKRLFNLNFVMKNIF